MKEGEQAIDFCLSDMDEREVCLHHLRGKWVVLYFYPKDNTAGCTREAREFSSHISVLEKMHAVVIGVSPNSPRSHKKFIEKHGLKVTLLSDETHEVLQNYGVWQKKKLYGREYYGVVRSTFLIDPEGVVVRAWKRVSVPGHAGEVVKALEELAQSHEKRYIA